MMKCDKFVIYIGLGNPLILISNHRNLCIFDYTKYTL